MARIGQPKRTLVSLRSANLVAQRLDIDGSASDESADDEEDTFPLRRKRGRRRY
ncbi:2a6e1cc5-ed8f-4e45-95e4-31866c658a0a [Thermothielavioides terrestris]|uniref:2a6e1cc5-ed8f-4e45-95e4-31866c658a0a n=1 Tax=Thermothielavioides terrestris TaxID=2587410 RepID=A0A446B892_9PEZI|nr:2a6e1cc5-ed8f-4e45-95e4-31866c658a0a [Thermothielavioides terrestris]